MNTSVKTRRPVDHDILKDHSSVKIKFKGNWKTLKTLALEVAQISSASIFKNVTLDCKPIAKTFRRHSEKGHDFMAAEVQKFLKEVIIELSNSSWRAQVFVVRNETHKHQMVIDCSQTVNKFTMLDVYPLSNIEELIKKISQFKVFSTIDLSAYHKIPIKSSERSFTAIKANVKSFQFLRVPFGVTNGVVASLQRTIGKIQFPLSKDSVNAFESLKVVVADASLTAVEEGIPFRAETDASEFAIGTTLSQTKRPIAFFSRTLKKSEQNYFFIEKEADAIKESFHYWRQFLIGRHFEIVPEQRTVSFKFDQSYTSKIKNEETMR
ncbi:endonuclease [Caerostris darwini]|uniref:Endonuclease n=1 Tax=Caerostris darwini TaxID=1538125 RepID=A0AAV4QY19_9ARAC|nr:endonuclease [Caerostris darwini]